MAVEHCRVQLEFRMGPDGWAEDYYTPGSIPKDLKSRALELVGERKKPLVSVASIHHVRISPANEQSIRSYRFPITNGAGLIGNRRDVGAVTVTIGFYSAGGAFRNVKLHGRPDDWVTYQADGSPNSALAGTELAFADYLIGSTIWEIKHRSIPATDPGLKTITDIVIDDGKLYFKCVTAPYVAGDKITVSGCKGGNCRQFNGNWTIGEVVALPVVGYRMSTTRLIDPRFAYIASTGKIRSAVGTAFTYVKMASHDDFVQFGTRKTGRPSDEHRGRRSSRR